MARLSVLTGLIAVLAMAQAPPAAPPVGADSKAPAEEAEFQATLVKVPGFPGDDDVGKPTWVIGVDAHYLLCWRIDKLLSGTAPFALGSTQRFLIHSPSIFFKSGTPQKKGAKHRIKVRWDGASAHPKVTGIELG